MRIVRGLATPLLACSIPISAGAARPASAPTSRPATVTWEHKGVRLEYPSDWRPKSSADYELMLLPDTGKAADRKITFDIPDLPPHLPFMIQIEQVEKGYIEDLKKAHPGLHVDGVSDASRPGSPAKLVRSKWHEDKTTFDDTALLIVHASAVYILDAQGEDSHQAQTLSAFDVIRASIQWSTKH